MSLSQVALIFCVSVFTATGLWPSTSTKTCTTSHCEIQCDKSHSCEGMKIDASNSSSLNIECSTTKSCSNLFLSKGPSDSISIKCTSPNACLNALFQFNTTKNAYIECRYNDTDDTNTGTCVNTTFFGQHSTNVSVDCNGLDCYHSKFHVNMSETAEFRMHKPSSHSYTEVSIFGSDITNALILKCLHSNSCRENSIYCPDNKCNIYCDDGFACALNIYMKNKDQHLYLNTTRLGIYDTDFHCLDSDHMSILQYQYDRNAWGCKDYTQECCPIISALGASVHECDAQSECSIVCDTNNPCVDIINATNAASLTIQCIGENSCASREIQCPNGDSASCNIICDGMNACKDTMIDISSMKLLNVSCVHDFACHGLRVWPSQFSNVNIDTVTLLCQKGSSCQNMTFGYGATVGVMDVQCAGHRSCQSMVFADAYPDSGGYTATVIDKSFTIHCTASMSCNKINMNIVSSSTAATNTILCNNPSISDNQTGACYKSHFSVYGITDGVGNWNISCNTYDCQSASIVWSGYSIYVNCYASNSCSEASFDGEQANHMDLFCRSTKSCYKAMVRGPSYAASASNIVCVDADSVCAGMRISSRWGYTDDYMVLQCPSRHDSMAPCDDIVMDCDYNYQPYVEIDVRHQQTCYLHYNESTELYDGCVTEKNVSLVKGKMYCCPIQNMEYDVITSTELTEVTEVNVITSTELKEVTEVNVITSTELTEVTEVNDDGDNKSLKSSNLGLIVGVISASVFVLVLLGAMLWYLCVSTQNKRRNKTSALLSEEIGDNQDAMLGVGTDAESQPYVPPTGRNGGHNDAEMTLIA